MHGATGPARVKVEPPSSYKAPAADPVIIVEDAGWRRLVPRLEERVLRSIRVARNSVPDVVVDTVVLTDDRTVRQLNARHRGRNKPTNVLTFEPAGYDSGGELVLALGVMRREAMAERKTLAQHLAHLLVHGVLHLDGEDHHHPGDARRMEMAESRILSQLRIPNPWREGR
jgi:probable rRNA maturation factor